MSHGTSYILEKITGKKIEELLKDEKGFSFGGIPVHSEATRGIMVIRHMALSEHILFDSNPLVKIPYEGYIKCEVNFCSRPLPNYDWVKKHNLGMSNLVSPFPVRVMGIMEPVLVLTHQTLHIKVNIGKQDELKNALGYGDKKYDLRSHYKNNTTLTNDEYIYAFVLFDWFGEEDLDPAYTLFERGIIPDFKNVEKLRQDVREGNDKFIEWNDSANGPTCPGGG